MRLVPALRLTAFIIALSAACLAQAASASRLDEIKARGELVVGVKDMDAPFGTRNDNGELIGLEIDLARDLAARLGVRLTLFPVSAASRLQFLELGKVDLVLATLAVTPHRQRQVALIEPAYFAGTPAFLAPKTAAIDGPDGLKGKPLCVVQGAYYLAELGALMPGSALIPFQSRKQAAGHLSEGRCAALVGEDVRLLYRKDAEADTWADSAIIPSGLPPLPWAIAVQPGDDTAQLRSFLAETVTDWHRSGRIVELQKKWLGGNTGWVLDIHERLK